MTNVYGQQRAWTSLDALFSHMTIGHHDHVSKRYEYRMDSPNPMYTRHDVLEANNVGTLIETIATTPYQQLETAAGMLSDLHNRGKIDFLACYESPLLAALSDHSFFALQRVFCNTLPRIDCSAEAAARACKHVFARAGNDGTAGLVYDSLTQWFRQSPTRTEEGLTLIHHDPETHIRLVRPVFLAGTIHDSDRYFEEAFNLSSDARSPARLDALWALGQIASIEDDRVLTRTFDRLDKVVQAPVSDHDTATIVEAALALLHRSDGRSAHAVELLLQKACRHRSPETRYALANGLLIHRRHLTEAMIDAAFFALRYTDRHDIHTAKAIDSVLYQWDLDSDRTRLVEFLADLLTREDDPLDLEVLSDFKHQLRNQPGDVLGWYVVSLLLTGDPALCAAAERLLPYKETPPGLDIDLDTFSLTPPSLLYLARKILGYCILNKESTAALLLSCLRNVTEQDRAELEELVLLHLCLNYLTAIDWFETAISDDDRAKQSVKRISSRVRAYVAELERYGTCSAFRPNDRERRLQGYRRADFQRDVHRKAEQGSVLWSLADKATILYGTASIAYVYTSAGSEPHRQEVTMRAYEHFLEYPRLDVFDPVGFQWHTRLFRSESPPS